MRCEVLPRVIRQLELRAEDVLCIDYNATGHQAMFLPTSYLFRGTFISRHWLWQGLMLSS